MSYQPRHSNRNNLPPPPEEGSILGVEDYYQPVPAFQDKPQTLAGMNDYEYRKFLNEHPELDQGALIVDAYRVVADSFRDTKKRISDVGSITVAKFKQALTPEPRGRYRAGKPTDRPLTQE